MNKYRGWIAFGLTGLVILLAGAWMYGNPMTWPVEGKATFLMLWVFLGSWAAGTSTHG